MSATQAKPPARLTDDQLADMMRLIGGADSVELKLTIPEDAHRATISNLNLDPVEAQPRQVFFFDTPTPDPRQGRCRRPCADASRVAPVTRS